MQGCAIILEIVFQFKVLIYIQGRGLINDYRNHKGTEKS